jgi:hypothetical protein
VSIDAVILLKPKSASALRAALDPDTFSGAVLDDGSIMLYTGERFDPIARDRDAGRALLSEALAAAHADPRGLLFFPDVASPRARTYDALVAELERGSVWVPARPLSAAEKEARQRASDERTAPFFELLERRDRGEAVDDLLEQMLAERMHAPADDPAETDALLSALPALVAPVIASAMLEGTAAFMLKRPSRRDFDGRFVMITIQSDRALRPLRAGRS